MQLDRKFYRTAVAVLLTTVAFSWALNNFTIVAGGFRWIIGILFPLLLGGAIAFILNVPMKKIEYLLRRIHPKHGKIERPLAIIITVLLAMAITAIAVLVIIPGVTEAVTSVVRLLPDAVTRLRAFLKSMPFDIPALDEFFGKSELELGWNELAPKLGDLLQSSLGTILSSGAGAISGIVSGIGTFFIGAMFSIYLLAQKERLLSHARQAIYALMPERRADSLVEVLALARDTFSDFLSGQSLHALILGAMFFAAMSAFAMPYTVLISVLVTLMAFVPIIGQIIGCVAGVFLILLVDPVKALIFLVLFLVLQQIEGSFIFPRIVGNAIGLPSIWVLAAVILGGNLWGIMGVLVFIPLCSVLYSLFRKTVKEGLLRRGIPKDKWKVDLPPLEIKTAEFTDKEHQDIAKKD